MERFHWIAVFGLGLVGGAIGGAGGARVWAPPPERADDADPISAEEFDDLADRVTALERRPLEQRVVVQYEDEEPIDLAGDSVAPSDEQSPTDVDDPVFEAAVADVIERVQSERRTRKDARRAERRQVVATEWSSQMVEPLNLTTEQRSRFEQLALEYMEQVRAARRPDPQEDGTPVPWQERRKRVDDLGGQYAKRLAEILDYSQMEAYRALEPEQQLHPGMSQGTHWGARSSNRTDLE